MNDSKSYLVEPLAQQCLCFVVMHLEEFPTDYLSLLPLPMRREMLRALPIADVCHLEETSFIKGLDMTEYWKSAYGEAHSGMVDPEDEAIKAYTTEWEAAIHAKAVVHGLAFSSAIECRPSSFCGFSLPRNLYVITFNTIAFLYCVRERCLKEKPVFGDDDDDGLVFPPRYRQQGDLSQRWREWFDNQYTDSFDEELKEDMIDAVMNCFKNQLPKYHGEITVYNDIELEYAFYFREVVYLGILSSQLDGDGLEFVMTVLEEATHLQILVMEFGDVDFGREDLERVSLDKLCSELSTQSTLLSSLRILKIQKYDYGCPGYVISRGSFDKLVSAYLSAPTDHPQKLHICDTIIMSKDTCLPPKVDGHYLHFKTITLDDCQFQVVSNHRATPRAIETQWLGKDINVLNNDNDSCSFKLEPEDMQTD